MLEISNEKQNMLKLPSRSSHICELTKVAQHEVLVLPTDMAWPAEYFQILR